MGWPAARWSGEEEEGGGAPVWPELAVGHRVRGASTSGEVAISGAWKTFWGPLERWKPEI